MNCKSLLFCSCFASLLSSTPAATVIKILHINPQAKVRAIWQESAQGFESAHPGVKVEFDYLENEAFKAKLPTLLQSKDRPSIFHSWGGGVMVEQIGSGICQDITQRITEDGFKDTFYPAAVQNFSFDGKYYGLPNDVAPEVLFYNKELCQKAGVDPTQIHYWEDLIEAVKKCKEAGITPMAVGGKDKWPLHFYTALLMMRILGKDGMQAVIEDKNGGFTNPEVLKAFQLYKDLTTLEPFQKGYLANSYAEAAGTFHDGKTAFHLMGTWDLTEGRANATDKQGLPNEKLGFIFFPAVKGGKGKATDMFANLNGWLIAKEAPKETIDFAKVWLGKEAQTKVAQQGLGIPALKGTADAIQDPLLKEIAQQIERSEWLESPMDQILGPDTGRVFNDVSTDIASGNTTPQKGAKAIEESWQQNKQ
jgi:raffinose/stachyose/melibiose transport system substrate-binding protein